MQDDTNVDDILNGENTETPAGSPPETTTTGDGQPVNPEGAANLSPEEVSWNDLKGNTQDRIKALLRERDEARRERDLFKGSSAGGYTAPPPPPPVTTAPDVQEGVRKLSEFGIATKDDVSSQVQQAMGSVLYQIEMDKLSQRFDGSNGLPRFDKAEYEDYVQRHPQFRNYDPTDVYEKMYSDEIFDWKLKNNGTPNTRQTTPSLRPTKTTVRDEVMTPELIEQRLREPDGVQWYEKNKDKVNSVLAKMALPE